MSSERVVDPPVPGWCRRNDQRPEDGRVPGGRAGDAPVDDSTRCRVIRRDRLRREAGCTVTGGRASGMPRWLTTTRRSNPRQETRMTEPTARNVPTGRDRRADERVQLVLPREAGRGTVVAGRLDGSPGHAGVPAGRLRHGGLDDPRGAVRAVRRRHAAGVHHELRRPVGRVHGGLLHVGADARAVRRDLPALGRLRRPPRPGRR